MATCVHGRQSMGPTVNPGRFLPSAAILLAALAAAGCVTSPVYTVKPAPAQLECVTRAPDKDLLIGLAVSGGGSRAAMFAAG